MVLSDKLFPHDISAEESVIGSLLLDGLSFTKIASFLEPEHFYLEPNLVFYCNFTDIEKIGVIATCQ